MAVPTECARVLRGHQGPVNAVRFNGDGRTQRLTVVMWLWTDAVASHGAAAKGTYVMTCGQDKTVRLWNPHRDGLENQGEALLLKTYEGRHGYDVRDVAMYVRDCDCLSAVALY